MYVVTIISALIASAKVSSTDSDHVIHHIAKGYVDCRSDLDGRAPGAVVSQSINFFFMQ